MNSISAARDDFAGGFFVSGTLTRRERAALLWLTAAAWWLSLQGAFALGWVALVPLFIALDGLAPRARFFAGWKCGWLAYASINWWIIPTVVKGSPMIGAPPAVGFFLGCLSVALIGAIHGFLVALVAFLWAPDRFRRASWVLPIVVATAWALLDAARLETPLAHGWGALAYSQARDAAILPHARWMGQHGLSALCIWSAACLAVWMMRSRTVHSRLWLAPVGVLVALHLISPPLAPRSTKQLNALLVQTNVPSLSKNFSMGGESGLQQAIRLTREANGKFNLIVWPETTFDAGRLAQTKYGRNRPYLSLEAEQVARVARESGAYVLCGANARDQKGRLFNAAILFEPDGGVSWTAKSRLVPFGEQAPFGEILPLLRRFAPSPELAAPNELGSLAITVRGETVKIGAVVCFESCFRYPARALGQQGAQLRVVLTNDEWFLGTTAPREHAAMLAIRAAENGVTTAQSANGGLTVAVDPSGRFMLNGTSNTARADSVLLPY
jgi:apolipoprotein N-acyltransferase